MKNGGNFGHFGTLSVLTKFGTIFFLSSPLLVIVVNDTLCQTLLHVSLLFNLLKMCMNVHYTTRREISEGYEFYFFSCFTFSKLLLGGQRDSSVCIALHARGPGLISGTAYNPPSISRSYPQEPNPK